MTRDALKDVQEQSASATNTTPSQGETILVFDFGSQTAQLITRRVREQNVFCQLVRHDLPASRVREINPKGIIFSGGPASVYGENAPQPDPEIFELAFELGIPILGICYGMQLVCRSQGSDISPGESREFGNTPCQVQGRSDFFAEMPEEFTVWMSHGDQVNDLDSNFESLAATKSCPHAAVKHREKEIYGLQFHPEVTHTDFGGTLLANFVKKICGL